MSDPTTVHFDPVRLARHFSVLQPLEDPVQAAQSGLPACCLETRLQVRAAASQERTYSLMLPLESHLPNESPDAGGNRTQLVMSARTPWPVIQMLATPDMDENTRAEIIIRADGPAECPAGRPNEVAITAGPAAPLVKQVPFAAWVLPVRSTLDFAQLLKQPDALLSTLHPFRLPDMPAAVCQISLPACGVATGGATVAIFPDVRWTGKVEASLEPDLLERKGFRIKWESSVLCRCGGGEWRPQTWDDFLRWCPWLGVLEPIGRSLAAISALREGSRAQGLDNPRLVRAADLQWTWPKAHAEISSALSERSDNGLLSHQLDFRCVAEPLVAASGELSLLAHWLESALWLQRLGPLLVGLEGKHMTEIAHELGLWLVPAGNIMMHIRRQDDRPTEPTRVTAERRGKVSLLLEGRTTRDYETLIVRAGDARKMSQPATLTFDCAAPPDGGQAEQEECKGFMAFSGLALWGLEKLRPGIRIRRIPDTGAGTRAPASGTPLATLLSARVWPSAAAEEATPVPWYST